MQSVKNKIVVVTGGTRGFGFHLSGELLKSGAKVIITGRNMESLEKSVSDLKKAGNVTGYICDVRQEQQVYELAKKVVDQFGKIDIWINNAGYSAGSGEVLDIRPEQVIDMFLSNDMGTFYGSQAALRHMLPRKAGTLVNVYGAGSNGKAASPMGMYATTKMWITSFTRTLSAELKGKGVQVIGFSPGMMSTDMLVNPVVVGESGKEKMKNFGFVLRFLVKPPQYAARMLVRLLEKNQKDFVEFNVMKPWTPMLGLLKVGWENLTKTGKTPEYTLHYEEAYNPKIY